MRYRHDSGLLTQSFTSLPTELYNPKAFVTHAAWLRQAFAHCAIFPTAASRRSLDRVSVPVWLIVLSDQLPITALVSRYLTNKLMGRRPILEWQVPKDPHLFPLSPKGLWSYAVLAGLSARCPPLQGTLPTCYSPVRHCTCLRRDVLVRLACVKPAASVRSEPGSNSPVRSFESFDSNSIFVLVSPNSN